MRNRVWLKMPRAAEEGGGYEKVGVREAAKRLGVTPGCLYDRLHRGVSKIALLRPGYGPRDPRPTGAAPTSAPTSAAGRRFLAASRDELSAERFLELEGL